MNKTIVLFLMSLFLLHSCSVNSEIVYHQDAASTFLTDIDSREFMSEMMAMTPDSLKQKEFGEMDRLPTTWTSMYDLAKKEGKLKTENPDTIRIMKKIFMKSAKENNQLAGFSFKTEHFLPEDYLVLKSFTKREKIPLDQNVYNNWDGKTLVIDTQNFNLKSIEESIQSKTSKEEAEKIAGMMAMFFKKIGTTLKFERPIQSIKGKHDWVKQIDNHSIRIEYDLKALYDQDTPLKNADKKIIIITE